MLIGGLVGWLVGWGRLEGHRSYSSPAPITSEDSHLEALPITAVTHRQKASNFL